MLRFYFVNKTPDRLQDEPATSSPLNSLYEMSAFSRNGHEKVRQSMRSSEFEIEKFRPDWKSDFGDDEGFFSDATISVYYQHSSIVKIEGHLEADIGVQVSEWRSTRSDQTVLGLKVSSVEAGKLAAAKKFFFPGDGILEVNQIPLASGSLSSRYEIFRKALREAVCVVRIVTQDIIHEIESFDSR